MTKKLVGIGLFLTVTNVVAGGLGYIFQVLMGRMLAPGEFAVFSAVVSMAVILTSPISAFATVISRNVTQVLVTAGSGPFIYSSYKKINKNCIIYGIGFLAVTIFASETIKNYIKNATEYEVFFMSLMVVSTALGMVNNAYLQGVQRYRWLAGMSVSTVLMKILFAVCFVGFGFAVDGALFGAVCATLAAYFIVFRYIKKTFAQRLLVDSSFEEGQIFCFAKLGPILVANVGVSLMTQLDVFLVNNFFDPNIAGSYAAAATLGKAVLYLPGGIVLALFPMVAEAQAKKDKVSTYVVAASMLTLVLCSLASLFYWILGDWLINLLYGSKYDGVVELLKFYSLAMIPMAMLIVAEYFLMALGKVIYAWLSLIFAPVQVLLIFLYHQNVFNVLWIVGVCGLLLLLSGYLFLFRSLSHKV